MTSKRMTRAEMIQWLGDAIRTETEKPFDEIDYDFVDECGNLLDELMGESAALSESEIKERVAKLTAGVHDSDVSKGIKIKRRNLWKIAVAAAVVLCMGVTVFAVPALREIVISALQLDVGKSVENDGITYINGGTVNTYENIDLLISAENLDILSFEDSQGVLEIISIDYLEDADTTIISFNDPSVYFEILHNINYTVDSVVNNSEKYITTAGFSAYMFSNEISASRLYSAYIYYKNDTYLTH